MTDYGATATLDRKGRPSLPPSLMMEDRPDPDMPNRTVRGARRTDCLAVILGPNRAGWDAETQRRYWAAELYRDDLEIGEDGANPNAGNADPTLRQGSPSSYALADVQADALARLRDARTALPVVAWVVFRDVVRGNKPLVKVHGYSGRRHSAIRNALMVGLDALAVHYEGMGR